MCREASLENKEVCMKNRIKLLFIICLMCLTLFSGCQIGDKSIVVIRPLNSRYVFKIGEVSCELEEARLYLANYQNLYGTAYTLDLWQHDFGNESLEAYIKNITINELVAVVCMAQLADAREITLSEEELVNIKSAAEEYYLSLTEAEVSYFELSQEDIENYYKRYALAQKVYFSLTGEISHEVSDDEARVMEVMQIFVTDSGKAAEIAAKLQDGEDFANIAKAYNELENIQCYFSRNDVPVEVEKVAFAMDNNEISELISVEGGYYFVKCLNKYLPDLTEANKVTIVEKREKAAFEGVYNEFILSLDSYINEEVWDSLELDMTSTIQTDSFFKVYEKYMGSDL